MSYPTIKEILHTADGLRDKPMETKDESAWNAAAKLPCGHPVGCLLKNTQYLTGNNEVSIEYCGWCTDKAESYEKGLDAGREEAAALIESIGSYGYESLTERIRGGV
jgi:hypothetical protein